MAKASCSGTTKAGKPCKAPPILQADDEGNRWCNTHHPSPPDGVQSPMKGEAHLAASRAGGAATRRPRVIDLLRERLESEYVEPAIQAIAAALEAQRPVVTTDKDGNQSVRMVIDHPTRIRAAGEAFDRAYGKAKQVTELTGADGGPLELSHPVDAENKSARAARLLAQALGEEAVVGAASALNGSNGNGNGNGGH